MNERERKDHAVLEGCGQEATAPEGLDNSPLETLEKAVGLINKVLHKQVRLATESKQESQTAATGFRELKQAVRPVVETLKDHDLHPRQLPGALAEWERLKEEGGSRERVEDLLRNIAEVLTTQARLAGDFEGMAGQIHSLRAQLAQRDAIIERLRADLAQSAIAEPVETQAAAAQSGDDENSDDPRESYREALQTMVELEDHCGQLLDGNMELMDRLRSAQRERLRAEAELEAIKAAQAIRKVKL
jgi:hypothetical protein